MLLKIQWINDQIEEEIRRYLKTNDNENTTLQNPWDAAKAILREKFIVIQVFPPKQEKTQINNLTYHIKESEKEEQTKPEVSRMEEI